MTTKIQIVFVASALALLTALAPVTAYANRTSGIAHTHTQTTHDRAPTVHQHGSRSHHG